MKKSTQHDEKKAKRVLTGQIRLPEELAHEIDQEASRRRLFKYEVVEEAWRVYKSSRAGADSTSELSDMGGSVPERGSELPQRGLESVSSDRSDSGPDLAKAMETLREALIRTGDKTQELLDHIAEIPAGTRRVKKRSTGDGGRSGKKAS